MLTFIRKFPSLSYFTLTFLLSWGGMIMVIGGPARIPGTQAETTLLLPFAVAALVIGPSLAGIVMTGLVHGRSGFRELWSRMLRWRVGARWYVVALFTAPAVVMAVLMTLSLASPEFLPRLVTSGSRSSILLSGLAAGLVAGVFEEVGWTGFVLPELRKRYSVLQAGAIVGILWGAWHYIVACWGSGDPSGTFALSAFLPHMTFYVGVLPAYRVLMAWVYDHNKSVFVAMIMHGSLTAHTTFILMPVAAGYHLAGYYLVLSLALLACVIMLAFLPGGRLTGRTQAAAE